MHLGKHLAQICLQDLVFAALVELADEMAAGSQRVAGKLEGGSAEVLEGISRRQQ